MLKGLNHQNICSIAYVCLSDDDVDRPLVLTPNMNQGNLKNFLKKSRTPEGTGLEKVRVVEISFYFMLNYFTLVLLVLLSSL